MINQTPGLWDMIKPEAMAFMGQAMQRLNPDFYASKRLQEMIQQNPMVLDQIANMDDTQRAAFAQQMGFRKQNPIAAIAPGTQRQEREQVQAYQKTMTPEQQDLALAKKAGTVSRFELGRTAKADARAEKEHGQANQLFDLTLAMKGLEEEEKSILLNEQKRALGKLAEARAKYPQIDFQKIMRESFSGQLSPEAQGMMTVISGDEALKSTMQTLFDLEKFSRSSKMQFSLRALGQQDDRDRVYLGLTETARKEATDAGKEIAAFVKAAGLIGVEKYLARDPEAKTQYDAAVSRYNDARTRYKSIAPIVNKKFGIPETDIPELKVMAPPSMPTATTSLKISAVVERVRTGKATLAQLEASPSLTPEEKAQAKALLGIP